MFIITIFQHPLPRLSRPKPYSSAIKFCNFEGRDQYTFSGFFVDFPSTDPHPAFVDVSRSRINGKITKSPRSGSSNKKN